MTVRASASVVVAALVLVLCGPAHAQDLEVGSGVVAAAWCAINKGGDHEEEQLGCDFGVGAAAYRWKRAAIVGAIGRKTVGVGVAWVARDGQDGGPTIAFSFGPVAPYDIETGIDLDRWGPAAGATFGIGGRGE